MMDRAHVWRPCAVARQQLTFYRKERAEEDTPEEGEEGNTQPEAEEEREDRRRTRIRTEREHRNRRTFFRRSLPSFRRPSFLRTSFRWEERGDKRVGLHTGRHRPWKEWKE